MKILLLLLVLWIGYDAYKYHVRSGNKHFIYVGSDKPSYDQSTIGILF